MPTGLNLQTLNPALPPIADVYVGQLADPVLPRPGGAADRPLGRRARRSGRAVDEPDALQPGAGREGDLDIPLFVTVPNVASGHAKPANGWPVVIFQHGLTGNRTQAAAIAGAYASQGFVVAAIDIPLHGVTDTANPLYQAGAERTFDLDLVNNSTGAPARTASSIRRARTSST